MLTRRGKADMATALQQLVQRWRQNADMLAEGNTAEYADPAVGMQRACAADLEAALQPYLRADPAPPAAASEASGVAPIPIGASASASPLTPEPASAAPTPQERIRTAAIRERYGDHPILAALETLTILEEQIRQRFTPALNTGSALDGLRLVGEAIQALRAELLTDPERRDADPSAR